MPKGDALALETLYVAEDVKSQAEIDEAVAATTVKKEELALAHQLIGGLQGEFDPADAAQRVPRPAARAARRRRPRAASCREVEEAETETPVIDLMEALRASVAASSKGARRRRRRRRRRSLPASRKRAAAG